MREQTAELEGFFPVNPDLLCIADIEGNIIKTNQAWSDVLGYSTGELNHKKILDFVHPDDVNATCESMLNPFGQEKVVNFVNRYRCKDGSFRFLEWRSHLKGNWIYAAAQDITKRAEIDEKLINSEIYNRSLLSAIPDMMFVFDINGVFIDFKAGDDQDLAMPKEMFLGKNIFEVLPESLANQLKKGIHSILNHLPVTPFEYQMQVQDGMGTFECRMSAFGESKVIAMVQNITKRKQSEQALIKQSALQKVLMRLSSKYINIPLHEIETTIGDSLEELGRFVHADRTYIFEYDWQNKTCSNTHEWCEEGISPQIDELQNIPLEYVPQWVEAHQKGLSMNIPDIYSLPDDHGAKAILEPQGIKSLIAIPMMTGNECIGFIGFDSVKKHHTYSEQEETLLSVFSQMLVNVKNRAVLERNLIEEKRKAESANSAKSEFLANMSHEIRTPMNAILGFSEELYNNLESPKHRKMIKTVLSSGNLLLSLLNDILDLSKIEAGKLEIYPNPVNLGNLLQEIILLFKDKAQKKGIELNILIAPDFPKVLMLDEIRIKQIIFNLVGNAIKFTNKGFINIMASFANVNEDSGHMQLEVEDSGIGISERRQQLIFDAFSSQSGQSNREYGGAGLGLTISKRLVVRMNGIITVSSSEGKGSVFKISLPEVIIGRTEARKINGHEEIRNITFDKASILVIDDVESNIETIEQILSTSGLTIISAENGETALEILEHTSPELILLDIRMPGIDGYEVAKQIKRNDRTKSIPVIAFTASLFGSEKIDTSGDFDGTLFKPVQRTELYNLLSKFLKHSLVNQVIQPEQSITSNLAVSTPEIIDKLPEILIKLQEIFLPKWENIKDLLVFFKIEAFSSELKKMAQEYNFQFLMNYSDKINEDIDMVDLESLNETLYEFPNIINRISQLAKS